MPVERAVTPGTPADCGTAGVAGDSATGTSQAGRAADLIGRTRRAPTASEQTTWRHEADARRRSSSTTRPAAAITNEPLTANSSARAIIVYLLEHGPVSTCC